MNFAEPLPIVTLVAAVLLLVLAAPVLHTLVRRSAARPGIVRRPALIGGLCASVPLVAQALVVVWVGHVGGPTDADSAALSWSLAHRVGWAVWLGRVLAVTGGPAAMTVLVVVGVAMLVARGERASAAVVVASGLGAVALVRGLKAAYARPRPPPDHQVIHYTSYALPSGHALGSLVVVGVLAAVLALRADGAPSRPVVLTAAGAFVVAVGLSRIYLAVHWLTDVLVGWLLGGSWLAVGVTALVLLRRVETAAPPGREPAPPA